ncbi:hypothetical protein PSEUDO8AS_50087 [Pseudomonas sp. 8AS]|nr:hypothetical protein PSEUDO8AS_50087 [Pseudomonas sp. 8AS]
MGIPEMDPLAGLDTPDFCRGGIHAKPVQYGTRKAIRKDRLFCFQAFPGRAPLQGFSPARVRLSARSIPDANSCRRQIRCHYGLLVPAGRVASACGKTDLDQ